MTKPEIADLVAAGLAERCTIEGAKARLAAVEKILLELGAGTYYGTHPADKVQVIQPAPGIKPTPEAVESVRGQMDADQAKELFERVVTYKPKKSFREIARAILTKAKAAKIIAACEVPSAPYLRWS